MRFAAARPASTLAAVLLVSLVGALGLRSWDGRLAPDRQAIPAVVVTVRAENRPAGDLIAGVVPVLEQRMRALSGVAAVESETSDGRCRLVLATAPDADLDRLRLAAEDAVETVRDRGIDDFTVVVTDLGGHPTLELAVMGGTGGERSALVTEVLAPELSAVAGVERIEILGLATPHAVVTPFAAALAARGMSAADLVARLRILGQAVHAGLVREGEEVRPLVARDAVSSLAELRDVRIPAGEGAVRLGDVARVEVRAVGDGTWFRADGNTGTLLRVFRAPGVNAAVLASAARLRIAALGGSVPGRFHLRWLHDEGTEERSGLAALIWAFLAGVGTAALALRWLLGSWFPALALAAGAPAVVLAASAALLPLAMAPDLLGVAALTAAAGLLCGDLAVVWLAIAAARGQGENAPEARGGERSATILAAGCVAYVAVMAGAAGSPWRPRLGAVAAVVLAGAALAAALLGSAAIPALARLWKPAPQAPAPGAALYLRWLDRGSRQPQVLLLAGAAGVAMVATAAFLGTRIALPAAPLKALTIDFSLARGLAPEAAAERGRALDTMVRDAVGGLGAEVMSRSVGGWESAGTAPEGWPAAADRPAQGGEIALAFPRAALAEEAGERLRIALPRFLDARTRMRSVSAPSPADDSGEPARVYVAATGPAADRLRHDLAAACGTGEEPAADDGEVQAARRPEIEVSWRAGALAASGGDLSALGQQVRDSLGGMEVGSLAIPGLAPSVRVDSVTPAQLAAIPLRVAGPGGASGSSASAGAVPFAALASVAVRPGPEPIRRLNGKPAFTLLCPARASHAIAQALARHPADHLQTAAERQLPDAPAASLLAPAIGLLLVLGLPFFLVVSDSAPMACCLWAAALAPLAGATAAVCGLPSGLGPGGMAGLVVAMAVAVRPGLYHMSPAWRLQARDDDARRAVLGAAEKAYAAHLATALLAAAGLVPLFVVGGRAGDIARPLAAVLLGSVAGGLVGGLIVAPALHLWVRSHPRWR